ncbi:MAG: hypothetical protein ACI8XZ_002443 [Gammaproteobacteria bacterium]|jgi:hypothetical protein
MEIAIIVSLLLLSGLSQVGTEYIGSCGDSLEIPMPRSWLFFAIALLTVFLLSRTENLIKHSTLMRNRCTF